MCILNKKKTGMIDRKCSRGRLREKMIKGMVQWFYKDHVTEMCKAAKDNVWGTWSLLPKIL